MTTKKANQFTNYGDVSLEHGFILVAQDTVTDSAYRIITTNFDDDAENFILNDCYVDITDSWIDWQDVKSFADTDLTSPIWMAIDAISYYGAHEFQAKTETFETLEQLEDALKNDYSVDFDSL